MGIFCCGELGTGCVSAAGMKGWVDRLTSVPIGVYCLSCVGEDGCGVLLDGACAGVLLGLGDHDVAGCGGTTDSDGVC